MRKRSELDFGSDSFLDVICNIVGILIILIVVAGMKVSRSPVAVSIPAPAVVETAIIPDPPPESPPVAPPANPRDRRPILPEFAPEEYEDALSPDVFAVLPGRQASQLDQRAGTMFSAPPPAEEPPPAPLPAPELLERIARLRREIKEHQQRIAETESAIARLENGQRESSEQLQSALQQVEERKRLLGARNEKLEEFKQTLSASRQQAQALEKQIELLEAEPLPTQQVTHRITPVGKTVEKNEIHFQVLNNRVAFVPIEPLLLELKRQVQQRGDWLAKYPRHQGEIGPLRGFVMHYVVERQAPDLNDQLNMTPGVFRIDLTGWKLVPDSSLQTESVAEALKPGSQFYTALRSAPTECTLTFWVYPESFGSFRQLQAFAQKHNFKVAARPLPTGMQIMGSPSGSKSLGQ